MRRCFGCMEEYEEEYELCPYCGYVVDEKVSFEYHLSPGTQLADRYLIGRVLGFGGFGITYIGWDCLLERKVAIKEYLPSGCATRTLHETQLTVFQGGRKEKFYNGLEKFEEESKKLAKFQEAEGIVRIYDVVEENNTAYLIMEYLEGESLKSRMDREGCIPVDEAINLIKPILKSLQLVHGEGILHRDIAPDNIFLCKSEDGKTHAKLLDFGAARFVVTAHSHSLSVLIKKGYSPIEQYSSRGSQGEWTDVYAVAATLYHMITGVLPQDALERYVKDEVKPIRKLGIKIAKSTETAILNAMNITQEVRTQSAEEFLENLEADQVKRVHDVIIRTDIGSWPVWLKGVVGTGAAAVAGFIILLLTGVIQFDVLGLGNWFVPEGSVRVPNIVNMELSEAEEILYEYNLGYQIVDKEYSYEIPPERVLTQNYKKGSIVKENTVINLVISAGAKKVKVPDMIYYMQETATAMLDELEIQYEIEEEKGDVPPGYVISQSIEAGTNVDTGSKITLTVSLGMGFDTSKDTTVIDVTGMDYKEAKAELLNVGLYLGKTGEEYSDTIPKEQISSQNISAGEVVKCGEVVMVNVSAGVEQVIVPDVVYKTSSEAQQLLEENGLKCNIVYDYDSSIAFGNVIRQDIEANEEVDKGTKVTIYQNVYIEPFSISKEICFKEIYVWGMPVAQMTAQDLQQYVQKNGNFDSDMDWEMQDENGNWKTHRKYYWKDSQIGSLECSDTDWGQNRCYIYIVDTNGSLDIDIKNNEVDVWGNFLKMSKIVSLNEYLERTIPDLNKLVNSLGVGSYNIKANSETRISYYCDKNVKEIRIYIGDDSMSVLEENGSVNGITWNFFEPWMDNWEKGPFDN